MTGTKTKRLRRPMRVLTICAGAVCRSVGMAYLLKKSGIDAVALSHDWNTAGTFKMLCRWADRIVTMEPKYAVVVPEAFMDKLRICDVGKDIWVDPLHDELLDKCRQWLDKGGLM